MKKLKTIVVILIWMTLAGCSIHESKPKENLETVKEADELAKKMLEAIHFEAWNKTNVVQWSFRDRHHYIWDKKRNYVQVLWDENDVRLDLDSLNNFLVYVNHQIEKDKAKAGTLKNKAWEYFCNDSFWLNAPAKVFDNGTTRTIVEEKGEKCLLVSYASGGATPGDSYLWFLDKNYLPYKYKMWVSIIPIGGTEATWAKWKELETGALVATEHEMAVFKILIKNLKTADEVTDLGAGEKLFAGID